MKVENCILRLFEVRAKAGATAFLKEKLSRTSVAVVHGKPGNLGYFFGESVPADTEYLVFISVWKDVESIKALFGEDWEESFLPDGYEEIIDSCSIRHVQVQGHLTG